jgi:aarF domain-containing kinase
MQQFRTSGRLFKNLYNEMKKNVKDVAIEKRTNRLLYIGTFVTTFTFVTAFVYQREDMQRLVRIVKTMWHIKTQYQTQLITPELHQRMSKCLLDEILRNGGLFVKIGQTLASLHFILPNEWCQTFERCQDQVIPEDVTLMERILKREFGAYSSELFLEFDKVPFACASMAQIHKAKLKDGTLVCVKIQYSKLKENLITDFLMLTKFNDWIQKIFKEYDMKWLINEFNENITNEMDFIKEARNCDGIRDLFKSRKEVFSTPQIYWDLTSSRVITMEYIDGIKISNVGELKRHGFDPRECLYQVLDIFNEMVFKYGYFHADPHAGNIMVEKSTGRIILLDHGLYMRMSKETHQEYSQLVQNIYFRQNTEVKRKCSRLSQGSDPELFVSVLMSRFWSFSKGFEKETKESIQNLPLLRINEILRNSSKEWLLLYKINHFLKDLVSQLGQTDFEFYRRMSSASLAKNGILFETAYLRAILFWYGILRMFNLVVFTAI